MAIGLYGINGLYNFGCEAIVRGTVKIIRDINPNCEIIYFSPCAAKDRIQIDDLNIEVVQMEVEKHFVAKITNKILRIFNVPYQCKVDDFNTIVDRADIIFSIGGDIYTIPEYKRKNKKYNYYNRLVQFGEYAIKRSKPIVIYGASIGPFGEDKKAKKYYFSHLKKTQLIVCREMNCVQYLNENNIIDNVCFFPDPAFFVAERARQFEDPEKYIGINLSSLSLKEIYGDISEEKKNNLAFLIEKIILKTKMPVLLIPHVLSPKFDYDNDLIFLKGLKHMINNAVKNKVELIENEVGFMQMKKHLKRCRVVIAARMHCGISAVSEYIPTLFLSYSEKSKGMARFIYGNDDWVVNLQDLQNQLVNKVGKLLESSDEIREYLNKRMDEIRNIDSFDATERLRNIIYEKPIYKFKSS